MLILFNIDNIQDSSDNIADRILVPSKCKKSHTFGISTFMLNYLLFQIINGYIIAL